MRNQQHIIAAIFDFPDKRHPTRTIIMQRHQQWDMKFIYSRYFVPDSYEILTLILFFSIDKYRRNGCTLQS